MLRLAVDAKGIAGQDGPVTIAVTGPFASRGSQPPIFDLDVRVAAGGVTVNGGVVSTGERGFFKLQGSSYAVSDRVFAGFRQGFERARAQRAPTAQSPSLASLAIDPSRWMKDPRNQGEEEVAGQATVHLRSGIDVPRLLADVVRVFEKVSQLGVPQTGRPATMLTDRQRKAVTEAIEDDRVEVFSGRRDHVLRKLSIAFAFKVPKAQQQKANGLRSGKVSFDLELAAVNQPQPVRAPTNPKPFRELRGALGPLAALGSLLSPRPRSESSGGATAAPGQPSAQAYAQCVSAARGDLAKAQKCSTLLPGR